MGSKDISFFDLLGAVHSHGLPLEVSQYRADREILFQSRLGNTLYLYYIIILFNFNDFVAFRN